MQIDNYYAFGLSFNLYSREESIPQNIKFNGKEQQNELDLGWVDFGARMYDPNIARWHVTDPHAQNYWSFSQYVYALNQPLNIIDPNGKDVYFLIYDPKKDPDFKNALDTRKREIQNSKTFNSKKDHVYVIAVSDLGKLGKRIDEKVKDAQNKGYGKTVEVSFFGHAGGDGPVGSQETSGANNLAKSTGQSVDGNQLSPKGWNAINWNFDKTNSIFSIYGCNGDLFAEKFIQSNPDVAFTSGSSGSSGDTYSLDKFSKVVFNLFERDTYITGAVNGEVLETQVFQRGKYFNQGNQRVPMNEGYYMMSSVGVKGNVTIQNGVPVSGSVKIKE
jgi:RHS repeat-associated protein